MNGPIYKVKDWQKHFENNRSRTVENLRWVCVPNKHDGEGYAMVMEQENAAELFAAWVLILQVASKCQERGTLMREDGSPMTAKALSVKTRAPESWFKDALNFFITKVKWLECHLHDGCLLPDCHPTDSEVTKKEGREEKGMEGKERTSSRSAKVEGFSEFWSAYPRKVGKGEAEKVWLKLSPPLALVLESISWQRESREWLKEGGQFIPHPATWLNGRRWEDEKTEIVRADSALAF